MGVDSPSTKNLSTRARASSLKDLTLLTQRPRRNCRSLDRLPESVSDCFEKSTFFSRCHNRLLIFFGRGSRYKMVHNIDFNSMPRTKSRINSSGCQTEQMKPLESRIPLRVKVKSASSPNKQQRIVNGRENLAYLKTLWSDREEEELNEQYYSLRQMAKSRKSSARLRKIRESLLLKTKNSPQGPHSRHQEQMRHFLTDIGFIQYHPHFNRHGYDLETATHMDVMDLVALGVRDPLHRMALKYELDQARKKKKPIPELHETTSSWLTSLGLPEYIEHFHQNGIHSPLSALQLTRRDLHVMGIFMLGHRKKILMSISEIKEAIVGRRVF